MTWLEFISATIGQLVWPVIILVIVIVLRKAIQTLAEAPGSKEIEAGVSGIKVKINSTLDHAKREIEQEQEKGPAALPTPEAQQVAADFMDEMQQLAEVLPRAAVLESFARLEKVAREAVEVPDRFKSQRGVLPGMKTLSRLAVDQGLLSDSEADVLYELSRVRNTVAHSSDEVITYDRAVEYAELARQLAISFRLAGGETALDGPPL